MRTSLSQSITGILIAGTSLLSVFSSTAQAHWSDPVYIVSNRTPEIIPDLGTPFAEYDAYGYNYGDELVRTLTKGTITAEFTWVHDVANDTPPSDVYVLQHAEAAWDIYNANARAGRINAGPSVQEAVFVPNRDRHKVRVRLVQDLDEPPSGTADNGLDDAQDVVYSPGDGKYGNSSGYKAVLCHPATDGILTTPALTMSADVTAPTHMKCYSSFAYSAQIIDLKITRNGDDVTYPNNPEVPVMVGEKNIMNVSTSTLPIDIGTPTYQWTIPGDTIKDFTETAGTPGNPTATPPTPPTPFTGIKTSLLPADLQTQDPHFYWYNGGTSGLSQVVQCVVTIDGKSITLNAHFDVYKPDVTSFTAENNKTEPLLVGYDGTSGNIIYLGLTFNSSVHLPNVTPAAGKVAFKQIVSINRQFKNVDGATTAYAQQVASPAVDSSNDDLTYHREEINGDTSTDSTVTGVANATLALKTSDAPLTGPLSTDVGVIVGDSFKMCVVYKPTSPGAIWVSLSKVDWNWGFSAQRVTGGWNITGSYPQVVGGVRPADPTSSEFSSVLEYSSRGKDVKIVQYSPTPAW